MTICTSKMGGMKSYSRAVIHRYLLNESKGGIGSYCCAVTQVLVSIKHGAEGPYTLLVLRGINSNLLICVLLVRH